MEHNYYVEFADGSYLTARSVENRAEFAHVETGGQTVPISRDEIERIETVTDREVDGDRERVVLNTGEEIEGPVGARGTAGEHLQ